MSDEQHDKHAAVWAAIQPRVGELVAHPLADYFPMIPDAQLMELGRDIAENGLIDPIVLWGDTILDGRNRHAGMKLAGVEFERDHFVFFNGTEDEAAAYVAGKNVFRRNLTEAQRAMAAASLRKARGLTIEQAAEIANSHKVMVQRAARVQDDGPKHLAAMVNRGELGLNLATEAMRSIPKASLGSMRSATAIKEALKKQGKHGNEFQTWPTHKLVSRLCAVLETISLRDVTELVDHQAALDTAHQHLISTCQAVSEEKAAQAESKASAA